MSRISDRKEDSDFSSVMYMNQIKDARSHRTKSHSSHSDILDIKIKTLQGILEIKRVQSTLLRNIFLINLVFFLAIAIVTGVTFFYLYQNQLAIMGYTDETFVVPTSSTITKTGDPFKGFNKEMFFWASQIYDRLSETEKKIKTHVSNSLYQSLKSFTDKLHEQIDTTEKITQSFKLILENAERFEFYTPLLNRKKLDKGDPNNGYPPILNPPEPTKKTKWIGPKGRPGEAIVSANSHMTSPSEIRDCEKGDVSPTVIV